MSRSNEDKNVDLSSTLKEIMGDYKEQAETLYQALISVKKSFKDVSTTLDKNKITLDPLYEKHREYIFNQFQSWLKKIVDVIDKHLKEYDKANSKEKLHIAIFTYLDVEKRNYLYSPKECD